MLLGNGWDGISTANSGWSELQDRWPYIEFRLDLAIPASAAPSGLLETSSSTCKWAHYRLADLILAYRSSSGIDVQDFRSQSKSAGNGGMASDRTDSSLRVHHAQFLKICRLISAQKRDFSLRGHAPTFEVAAENPLAARLLTNGGKRNFFDLEGSATPVSSDHESSDDVEDVDDDIEDGLALLNSTIPHGSEKPSPYTNRWTEQEDKYLLRHQHLTIPTLTAAINAQFESGRTIDATRSHLRYLEEKDQGNSRKLRWVSCEKAEALVNIAKAYADVNEGNLPTPAWVMFKFLRKFSDPLHTEERFERYVRPLPGMAGLMKWSTDSPSKAGRKDVNKSRQKPSNSETPRRPSGGVQRPNTNEASKLQKVKTSAPSELEASPGNKCDSDDSGTSQDKGPSVKADKRACMAKPETRPASPSDASNGYSSASDGPDGPNNDAPSVKLRTQAGESRPQRTTRRHWTEQEDEHLMKLHAAGNSRAEIVKVWHSQFGTERSARAVNQRCNVLGIALDRRQKYTAEHDKAVIAMSQALEKRNDGQFIPLTTLAKQFNHAFNLAVSRGSLKEHLRRLGLHQEFGMTFSDDVEERKKKQEVEEGEKKKEKEKEEDEEEDKSFSTGCTSYVM